MIGHGATDIIDTPSGTIFLNIIFSILIHNCNIYNRRGLLIGSSIYHIAQDIPCNKYRYAISTSIHYLWLKNPIIAKLHLLLIHTPIHYYRIYLMKNNFKIKLGVGICTSIIGNIILEKKIDIKLNDKLGELWWVAPILSHIILTNYIIKENKKQ
tara:strand:- start:19029 stop:19493 length:465 start_codon:yes stop_codon:yes gene_type:complete